MVTCGENGLGAADWMSKEPKGKGMAYIRDERVQGGMEIR